MRPRACFIFTVSLEKLATIGNSIHQTLPVVFTETHVSNCDSCPKDAVCLQPQERGDSFVKDGFTCVCAEGFVGDGLTCYNIKQCSDSSCCSPGYKWSTERGCVDIDECSLPDFPCPHPQVCQNTPGSFECLEPSLSARSRPASESVQFDCGHTICPVGMDCVPGADGFMTCIDPCAIHSVLNDNWRAPNNTLTQGLIKCDASVNFQGWYRFFLWQTSAHIPERCVAENRCGTQGPMWITEPHPTQSGIIVGRSVCSQRYGRCCHNRFDRIYVKLCPGNYFVYKLRPPGYCNNAYCAGILLKYINSFKFILLI